MTDRFLQVSVLFMTVFITAGLYAFPQSTLMSLASTTGAVYILRVAVTIGALAMLFTRPPRTTNMRLFLGSIAALLFSWVSYAIFQTGFPLLDGLLFAVASVMFGLGAMELTPAEKKARHTLTA